MVYFIHVISNFAFRIVNYYDTHVRASLRDGISTHLLDYPHNYALCIMNYEL